MEERLKLSLFGEFHDWSARRIIPFLILFSFCNTINAAEVSQPIIIEQRYLIPAITALVLAIFVHFYVPYHNRKKERNAKKSAYYKYVLKSIELAKKHFGQESSIEMAEKLLNIKRHSHNWLQLFENHHVGVPDIFQALINSLEKYQTLAGSSSETDRYIPYISYVGTPTSSLDHEHPIWHLDSKDIEPLSAFLFSQNQVDRSIEKLYSDEYLAMARSACKNRQSQWYNSAYNLVFDIAEHYINLKELEKHINKNT